MNALTDVIRAQSTAIQRAFHAGHEAGYAKGFADALAEARKILKETVAASAANTEMKLS